VVEMKVSACIVTRGDVDTDDVVCSFPEEWEVLLWNNSEQMLTKWRTASDVEEHPVTGLSVYGRYAAIRYASHDLIYVQDDDCIVSDPKAILDAYCVVSGYSRLESPAEQGPFSTGVVACNMPPEFRHSFYQDHALVGFGAVFHRDAPKKAFEAMFSKAGPDLEGNWEEYIKKGNGYLIEIANAEYFRRTCDIVFTALTPRALVDVPVTNLDHAYSENRMYRQPDHVDERRRMLELALKVRDEPSRA
jgi:hypothetical protein